MPVAILDSLSNQSGICQLFITYRAAIGRRLHTLIALVGECSIPVVSRFQPLGVILPAKDWATILPSRTTNVSMPTSYTLSAVSAVHRM